MGSRDWESWTWREARELLLRAGRVERSFVEVAVLAEGSSPAAAPSTAPPVNVVEAAGALVVTAALPGVDKEDVELRLENGTLVIAGQRRLPECSMAGVLYVLEIPRGRFERRIRLPGGAALGIESAVLDRGLLTVTMRRRP